MSVLPSSFLGKYRVLVFAIAAFFALNVGVYSLNFMLLHQVEIDAAKINLSGKLRGYSQQLAKAILTLSHEMTAGELIQTSQAQISEAYLAFRQALTEVRALVTDGGDSRELELLEKLGKQWLPLEEAVVVLVAPETPDSADVQAAVTLSNTRNVRLLQLADDLTRQQEELAAERAHLLRYLQSGAIALALINFLFIVIHVARSLRQSDRKADQARRETEDILRTVREGLFLIDRSGTVGSQRSTHLGKVFPQPLPAGGNFLATLATLVSDETMESARDYIDLLFNKKVKPALLADLNPLQRVQINAEGRARTTHLSFSFQPVRSDGDDGITALLVAAADVSQEVRLERELADAEERARSEVSLLLGVLENDPADVARFLGEANAKIERLNGDLREIPAEASAYTALVNKVLRVIHAIKGEAAALSIGTVATQAHEFEDSLSALRGHRNLGGDDLIPIATGIGHLRQEIAKVEAVIDRIAAYSRPDRACRPLAAESTADDEGAGDGIYHSVHRIQRLALAVAADLNKKLRVETSLHPVADVPEAVHRLLREGLPQLVRNAVVHGIESAEERLHAGKQEEGRVRIELTRIADGSLELVVSDDGRGIDVHVLRRQLVAAGHRNAEQVAAMSDREVVATLFEPGFSTATEVTQHAGRGVGLDVLNALVRETGARLRIASSPRAYTRFTLQWSPA